MPEHDLPPVLIALGDDLFAAMQAAEVVAPRRAHSRRSRGERRRSAVRIAALGVVVLAALTGTALGAGSALGIIDLGGGASATPVTTFPIRRGGKIVNLDVDGQYVYELGGIGADGFVCNVDAPDLATFIASKGPLSQTELESLLDPSNPTGLNPQRDRIALGITSEGGGCYPASVAGPLGIPQTPSQKAAAEAFTKLVTQQILTHQIPGDVGATGSSAHAPRLRYVIVSHAGKRVIIKLSQAKSK
jgi:hypothetical protein